MTVSTAFKRASGALVLLVALATAANATDAPVTVTVDRAKVFRIDEPASTVIVGNPFIADVAMHDRNTVVVTGKAYGTTNLVILDEHNEPIIDEVLQVTASDENSVSVTRRTSRTTYSCAPNCEATLRLGDEKNTFENVAAQSSMRNDLAVQAAGGGK